MASSNAWIIQLDRNPDHSPPLNLSFSGHSSVLYSSGVTSGIPVGAMKCEPLVPTKVRRSMLASVLTVTSSSPWPWVELLPGLWINEIMGFNHRILLNFQFGYGFRNRCFPDWPKPSFWDTVGFAALRNPLSGRCRARFRNPDHRPAHGGSDPGLVIYLQALENLFRPQLQAWFVLF